MLRLVHELEVHQIELEMQQEEVVHARTAQDECLGRYTELYDSCHRWNWIAPENMQHHGRYRRLPYGMGSLCRTRPSILLIPVLLMQRRQTFSQHLRIICRMESQWYEPVRQNNAQRMNLSKVKNGSESSLKAIIYRAHTCRSRCTWSYGLASTLPGLFRHWSCHQWDWDTTWQLIRS